MKKILAFLLAAMMVLAFAACGEDNGGEPAPQPREKEGGEGRGGGRRGCLPMSCPSTL